MLVLLGEDSGAVIEHQGRLYWLVPVGTVPRQGPAGVVMLPGRAAESAFVGMPPVHWTRGPGMHWRVPAERGTTCGDLLYVAARIAWNTMPGQASDPLGAGR
ncbi:hypothetical protein ACFFHI_02405 [Streptomyces palmae]|uniref:hypothetical protein n=1 Tax=Streptomyces palmae TaxID=1701085 RepID=UPI0035F0EC59